MRGVACAKVNLSLEVGRLRPDGFHDLRGLFQSISWHDRMRMEFAEEPSIVSPGGGPVPDGDHNSAMRAVRAVQREAGSARPVAVELDKRIASAAGLGGGSADAALALAMAGRLFGVARESLAELAPEIGSDVPFCLRGGTAAVAGRGERLKSLDDVGGYALALVVPPIELSTPAVYGRWDELGGPAGPVVGGSDLPPGLRDLGSFRNDLFPAAAGLAAEVDEWRDELSARWGRPVVMSGSGPTLFSYFVDEGEASAALDEVPAGARAAEAAVPVPFGWVIDDDGEIADSTGRTWGPEDAETRERFRLID